MSTPEETLNSEPNDLAGNRVAGPVGNTAARPSGPVVGQPGGVGNHLSAANAHAGDGPADAVPAGQEAESTAAPATTAAGQEQLGNYGGNFSNSTQEVDHDRARYDNLTSDANRGEFGVQSAQGTTHGGYGNQNREHITEHQGPAEHKYYGEGNVRPGSGDHNAYRSYDGRDQRPDVRPSPAERTVADTPPAGATPAATRQQTPADNRNLPDRTDPVAAFQNDNGAAKAQGGGYAADYGHTSGVGLPRPASAEPQAAPAVAGRNQAEDDHSMRGGYDPQTKPAGAVGPGGGAPAPSGPGAPQGEGYGYGYQQSEQPRQPDRQTGSSRQGTTPGTELAQQGGDTSAGYGSEGGSYDDQNPGAHPDGLDQYTRQDQAAQNGPGTRAEHRPEGGDEAGYGPAPRRNEGRDEAE